MVISSVEYFLADKGVVVLFLVTYGRRRLNHQGAESPSSDEAVAHETDFPDLNRVKVFKRV